MKMRIVLAVVCSGTAPLAAAEGFNTFNQASLARAVVLPALTATAPLPVGQHESRVTLDWSNETYEQSNSRENLLIDAESQRLSFSHRRRFADNWEWSAELPLLFTGGGALDGLIEGWHSVFGLPNGNRDTRPQDVYRIRYVRDGQTRLNLAKGHEGLGDARLGLRYALSEQLQLQALVQLPTGERKHLTGGHSGAAVWMVYRTALTDSGRASLDLAAGASAAETRGPLSDLQAPVLALGSAVLTLPLFGALDGVVQLNAHSAPYRHSGLAPLGDASVQLAFGVRYPWSGGALELAIEEDPSVNASPDFGIHLALRFNP